MNLGRPNCLAHGHVASDQAMVLVRKPQCDTEIISTCDTPKLTASQLVADICTQALHITGTTGYRNDSPFSVTRHLRDADSAALMIGNERIQAANGALHMVYPDEAL